MPRFKFFFDNVTSCSIPVHKSKCQRLLEKSVSYLPTSRHCFQRHWRRRCCWRWRPPTAVARTALPSTHWSCRWRRRPRPKCRRCWSTACGPTASAGAAAGAGPRCEGSPPTARCRCWRSVSMRARHWRRWSGLAQTRPPLRAARGCPECPSSNPDSRAKRIDEKRKLLEKSN